MTSEKKVRVGILGSTRGSALRPIVKAWKADELSVDLVAVLSNRRTAPILDYAREVGIEAIHASTKGLEREQYDQTVTDQLLQHSVDLVLMIGYMRIVSPPFVRQWQGRLLNIHPSLLPKHGGLMDLDVHQSVLDSGENESGCTLHLAEEEVDSGKIVLQKRCPVFDDDTAETLKARVQTLEAETFLELLRSPSSYLEGLA